MYTRKEILELYDVNEYGRIQSLGKFEDEMLYVPYFWNLHLNGDGVILRNGLVSIKILPEDRKIFPEIPKRQRVIRLGENDCGFVFEF